MPGERKRCDCGALYIPQHPKDNICPECRYYLRGLHSKNVYLIEDLRAEYNKHHHYKSYGQFVALLQVIEERRRRGIDNKREKENPKGL